MVPQDAEAEADAHEKKLQAAMTFNPLRQQDSGFSTKARCSVFVCLSGCVCVCVSLSVCLCVCVFLLCAHDMAKGKCAEMEERGGRGETYHFG